MRKPNKFFSEWLRKLPEDEQNEVVAEIMTRTSFMPKVARIWWSRDAIKKLEKALRISK